MIVYNHIIYYISYMYVFVNTILPELHSSVQLEFFPLLNLQQMFALHRYLSPHI